MIEVIYKQDAMGTKRIIGYVNKREVISVSNVIYEKWTVGMSSCLPSNIEEAKQYVECMNHVFNKMEEIK